jgi:hypothetical protein
MCAHDSLLLNDGVTIAEPSFQRKRLADEVHDVTVARRRRRAGDLIAFSSEVDAGSA